MAWEQRGSNLYYYRKKRRGRQVISEYVGGGPLAQLFSDLDQEERYERKQTRAQWQKQKQEVRSVESDLVQLHEITTSLVKATLLVSGNHPHKGQWRKKRNG